MNKMNFIAPIAALCITTSAFAGYEADIFYTGTNNGGNNYTFDFTVYNNTNGVASPGFLDYFLIDFDADADTSLYSNITWDSDNAWFSDAFEYDPGFGGVPGGISADDSIFGSDGGGIAMGGSLGGFQVSFDYAGSLGIDEQLFSFLADFDTLEENFQDHPLDGYPIGYLDLGGYGVAEEIYGTTQYTAPSGNAPEPGILFLFGTGLIGLFGSKLRKSTKAA